MKPSILVTYHDRPIALVNARHTTLLGPAAEPPTSNPRLRLHLYMAHYAQLIARAELPGPYRDHDAERYAQAALGEGGRGGDSERR